MVNENRFWHAFLLPYELAVSGFIIKLESLRKEFLFKKVNNPIESISGRVKTVSCILEKAERLGIDFHNIAEEYMISPAFASYASTSRMYTRFMNY